jgi:hypothetical protein
MCAVHKRKEMIWIVISFSNYVHWILIKYFLFEGILGKFEWSKGNSNWKKAKDVIGAADNKCIKLVFTVLQNILVKYQSDILLLPRWKRWCQVQVISLSKAILKISFFQWVL